MGRRITGERRGDSFRGVATRAEVLSLDCLDLQFPVKQMSKEMAKPMVGSWKRMKKTARYLVHRKWVIRRSIGKINVENLMFVEIVIGVGELVQGNRLLEGRG